LVLLIYTILVSSKKIIEIFIIIQYHYPGKHLYIHYSVLIFKYLC